MLSQADELQDVINRGPLEARRGAEPVAGPWPLGRAHLLELETCLRGANSPSVMPRRPSTFATIRTRINYCRIEGRRARSCKHAKTTCLGDCGFFVAALAFRGAVACAWTARRDCTSSLTSLTTNGHAVRKTHACHIELLFQHLTWKLPWRAETHKIPPCLFAQASRCCA